MYATASKLYNDLQRIYFDEYYDLSDSKRSKMDSKYDCPTNLTLQRYNYSEWYKEKPGDEEELNDLPPLERKKKSNMVYRLRHYQNVLKKEKD